MEILWLTAIATTVVAICLCFYFHLKNLEINERKSPPEAAGGGWPFIGHLNLLSGPGKPHLKLSDLADKHGPIFSIRLGVYRCVIVSSWELTQEIFTKNDIFFSDKPKTAALEIMCYDFAMFAFNKYGSYWREMRKICMQNLLSNRKVSTLGGIWETELHALTKKIHDSFQENGRLRVPMDMKKCFEDLALKMMVRIVAGSTEKKLDFGNGEKWMKEIKEFFKMLTVLTFSDVVPLLKWLDCFKGTKKAMKRTWKAMDDTLQSWLEQHKKLFHEKENSGHKGLKVEEDFMDEMIGISDSISQKFPSFDADIINKATCQAMILAGTDTSSATLTWILSLLLNNRHILKRAQEEVDSHVGRSRKLKKSDIENLVYIQAIIKESLRLYPPSFLNFPREASQDCVVGGYYIPAGTRMIVNLWKLHRDPSVWSHPLEFKPERFLEENRDLDFRGHSFQFLPFGGGRRICPGISLAVGFMELVVATLLHEFDIETPLSDEGVDMEEIVGAINAKATPLHVLLSPRLSSNLYD